MLRDTYRDVVRCWQIRFAVMLTEFTAPFEYCLQTELSPFECKQRLDQRLNLKNKALWPNGLEPAWGWVLSSGFLIRRSIRPGGMEARGSFRPYHRGTAIRVQMGAMPAMLAAIIMLVALTVALTALAVVRMQSPMGFVGLAVPALLVLIYTSLWRDSKEAARLLRLLQEMLQAHVLSTAPDHPCPPLNGQAP